MAKAINWPREFRDEVLSEDTTKTHCAIRLGTLYFENQYWVPDEIVDVRVNHLKVRKARIVGELKQTRVGDLGTSEFSALKKSLQSIDAVRTYLAQNYQQPVTPESLITVVFYQNQPLVPEEIELADDPHL